MLWQLKGRSAINKRYEGNDVGCTPLVEPVCFSVSACEAVKLDVPIPCMLSSQTGGLLH